MTATATKTKQIRPNSRKVDRCKAIDLVINHGLTHQQAADLSDCARSRISEIISEAKSDPDIALFADNKDKVFEGLQRKLINLADDDLLKSMLNKRGFTDVAILQDKISLLRGQATEIHDVNIRALIASIGPDKAVNGD